MASSNYLFLSLLLFLSYFFTSSLATRLLTDHSNNPMRFQYHNGPLLTGKLSISLIWYGKFTPTQRAIVSDFLTSLSSTPDSHPQGPQSVSAWWNSDVAKYYHLANPGASTPSSSLASFTLAKQVLDPNYSLGKSLSTKQLLSLISSSADIMKNNATVNVLLTSADVAVEGFCVSRCGTHGSLPNTGKSTFIWVGSSETQCPGQCAWPFHQPTYGPQTPALVAPNGDVGIDGIIINLAGLLAGTVTNPFGNGYYQGPKEAPLEASSACPGVYGKGAYPGYAGELLVDNTTGASYNANGLNGRKFLLPGLYDPITSSCSTMV